MKKGFTLVELIAVIIVLGIIIVIAVPTIAKQVQESKIEQFKEDARTIIKAVELYMERENLLNLPLDGVDINTIELDVMNLNGYTGIARLENNEVILETLSNETLCGYGSRLDLQVSKIEENDCYFTKNEEIEE